MDGRGQGISGESSEATAKTSTNTVFNTLCSEAKPCLCRRGSPKSACSQAVSFQSPRDSRGRKKSEEQQGQRGAQQYKHSEATQGSTENDVVPTFSSSSNNGPRHALLRPLSRYASCSTDVTHVTPPATTPAVVARRMLHYRGYAGTSRPTGTADKGRRACFICVSR